MLLKNCLPFFVCCAVWNGVVILFTLDHSLSLYYYSTAEIEDFIFITKYDLTGQCTACNIDMNHHSDSENQAVC